MGVGDSLEAQFPLRAAVPAGTWRIVGDGLVAGPIAVSATVRFDLLLRGPSDPGGGLRFLSFQNRFVRDPSPERKFSAVRYSASAEGPRLEVNPGDRLVLRVTSVDAEGSASFIVNGDGKLTGGEIPRLDLP